MSRSHLWNCVTSIGCGDPAHFISRSTAAPPAAPFGALALCAKIEGATVNQHATSPPYRPISSFCFPTALCDHSHPRRNDDATDHISTGSGLLMQFRCHLRAFSPAVTRPPVAGDPQEANCSHIIGLPVGRRAGCTVLRCYVAVLRGTL